MTSPLAQFNNARLLWQEPGGRSSPQDGFQPLPGQSWLITAFLKQVSAGNRSTYKDVIDLSISTDIYEGYITGSMPMQAGMDWRTYDFASDDIGIGAIIRDVLGDRLILKVEWW